MGKKALAAVSFGTTYPQARQAIDKIRNRLALEFPDYDIYRTFTSDTVIKHLAEKENIIVPTLPTLLETLRKQGYEEVRCQSLHVVPGREYSKMREQLSPYRQNFSRLLVGKPLLWDTPDYLRVTRELLSVMPHLADDEAYVFLGHGTAHPANAAYALIENCFRYHGAERVYVGTIEGFPHWDYIHARLDKCHVTRVYLAPFMIVAGDHAQHDLENDWKNRLESEGYEVETQLRGLGELDAIGAIFADHCRAAEAL